MIQLKNCSTGVKQESLTHLINISVGRRFFPGTPVSSTNKSDRHDIAEILLKVVLKTILNLTTY
jgi:hypothetical protein